MHGRSSRWVVVVLLLVVQELKAVTCTLHSTEAAMVLSAAALVQHNPQGHRHCVQSRSLQI